MEWVIDLLFPLQCISCGCEGEWWCSACFKLAISPQTFLLIAPPFSAATPLLAGSPLQSISSLFVYHEDQAIGKLIKQFKYGHAHAMKELWEQMLEISLNIPANINADASIIPIPLYRRRERERGYNQAMLLAQIVAKKYSFPLQTNLKRIRETKQQVKLHRDERWANVSEAFAWKSTTPPPQKIILVDDVYTTGATMMSAAETLLAAGAKEVHGFVLAKG